MRTISISKYFRSKHSNKEKSKSVSEFFSFYFILANFYKDACMHASNRRSSGLNEHILFSFFSSIHLNIVSLISI